MLSFTGGDMHARALNETHELLKAYAKTRYTFTPAGTVPQLTSWYEHFAGVRISERTFKRHTRALRDAGLIEVKHAKTRTYYTLVGFDFEMPTVKFLPTSDPGQFLIEESGTKVVRFPRADNEPGWFSRNCEPSGESDARFTGALPF